MAARTQAAPPTPKAAQAKAAALGAKSKSLDLLASAAKAEAQQARARARAADKQATENKAIAEHATEYADNIWKRCSRFSGVDAAGIFGSH